MKNAYFEPADPFTTVRGDIIRLEQPCTFDGRKWVGTLYGCDDLNAKPLFTFFGLYFFTGLEFQLMVLSPCGKRLTKSLSLADFKILFSRLTK